MRDLLILFDDLFVTVARLVGPDGSVPLSPSPYWCGSNCWSNGQNIHAARL
jgi:hypothetical protein